MSPLRQHVDTRLAPPTGLAAPARGPATSRGEAPVLVVGAGIGGLAAAVLLAAAGVPVQVLERAPQVGGKMRAPQVAGQAIDAGPTVFTMRWVFDELCEAAGTRLDHLLALEPCEVLARHAWPDGGQLDLLADPQAAVDAIARFAGPYEARRYQGFCERAQRISRTLEGPFLRGTRPTPLSLMWRAGWRGLPDMLRISPFGTLWQALGRHFHDPRLRQLFGRYATYCGSSPFLAPATLMLVAHVEREGVWRVRGGMHRVARALAALAQRHGAHLRCDTQVTRILVQDGRANGVELADGQRLAAQAVVFNGDASALSAGLLGDAVRPALPALPRARRSLSALTWCGVTPVQGFDLSRHTVFFSGDYRAEFDDLQGRRRLPVEPTVYVCAQDRGDGGSGDTTPVAERLLVLVNAPPAGDLAPGTPGHLSDEEIASCESRTFAHLARLGLRLQTPPANWLRTTPTDFERLFPGTGGALYGAASHGWRASFTRPSSACRMAGLVLAGGSTHPGPGVPMAALSGQLAAAQVLADRASTRSWHPVATSGGTSMR
ncbi:1-hydroxycarotenoid 3,4-desaturase CrtD [Ideonella sp. A 288]|uniref:1-hydroxycarotenoid 3,4-desaturase CrtD n=1 Tax=Ideonella sp. A 288 TaxID=1962181 RepID=UPI000B4A7B02|nr:1-hydroxycarotenoid 3,4-desaturase CrtD [Ideonella sp. A 288]